jgi:hypothetical protein
LYRVRGNAALSLVIEQGLFLRWENDPNAVKEVEEAAGKLRDLRNNN